ncbi:F0F1 ATP synthase subunit gamma [Candidatus Parcubacteria bacterium]|nr:F0F1 ATP synthase subunit gamma [Candidatus Parcubacteria bacterium]
MSKLNDIEREQNAVGTMVELTSVFEGIASMKIARIKNQVLQATKFFNDLWAIYTQLRVDSLFRFGRGKDDKDIIDKELYIIITAEGGFSGDIDQKLMHWMLKSYKPEKNDILVIGHHGAVLLAQKGISFKKYFKLPEKDQNINPEPIVKYVMQYKNTVVFYQQYISLMVQDIKRIELSTAVANISEKSGDNEEVISEANYIFEPSTYAVVGHLERSMLKIALSQLILDSKLAQYASRFRAMSASHQAADEQLDEVKLRYSRSKRAVKDERLKEIINGLRKTKLATGGS